MLEKIATGITNNPWLLAIGTVAFFAAKGLVWLAVPYLFFRWRKSTPESASKPLQETGAAASDSGAGKET
jgi:hypothetical protein